MIITIRDNLTCNITTKDDLFECELPDYNPETQIKFTSKEEVELFAKVAAINTNYFLPKLTDEEKATNKFNAAAEEVRFKRNTLISATDWRFRSDLTPSQEWKDYCQALRDITSQEGFPFNVVWPEIPQ